MVSITRECLTQREGALPEEVKECRLDILNEEPGFMVDESHGQPVVYDDNEQRADDRANEHIEKRHHGQGSLCQWRKSTMQCGTELLWNPVEKAGAVFYKAFEAAEGDVGRVEPSWGTVPCKIISYFF